MRKIKILFAMIFVAVSFQTAFAQQKLGGTIVEVIDGRTVAIELYSGGKLTAELQFIEVPEAEQQLHQIVINHLRNLTIGKKVEFRPVRIVKTKTIGQVWLNGIDVSQQMIRDGAAWYAIQEKTGQTAEEIAVYQSTEAQAKSEKRGIWGVENLKPAWQIRAEALEKRKLEEKLAEKLALEEKARLLQAEAAKPKPPKPVVRRELSSESQMWSQVNSEIPQNIMTVGGLMMAYDPVIKLGFVATPLLKLQIPENDGTQAIGIGIGYLYGDDPTNVRKSVYLVGIESESRDFRFLKQNSLIVTADGVKLNIGKAKRNARQKDFSVKEILTYEIKRNVIEKIANAKNVEVKVGDFQSELPNGVQMMLSNLLQASN